MIIKQKEHKKATLRTWSKEELIDYILMLEHNINATGESFDIQYKNVVKLLNQMSLVNKTYAEAKKITKQYEWTQETLDTIEKNGCGELGGASDGNL